MIPPLADTNLSGSYTWGFYEEREEIQSKVAHLLTKEYSEYIHNIEFLILDFQKNYPDLFGKLSDAVLEDFFTHPEVRANLNQKTPAPFPEGYSLPETDWSILEPVILRKNSSPYFLN